eukprot:Em0013g680a
MKAIIVVDSSGADIAFYSLDKAFEQYIVQRFSTLGYTEPNDAAEESSRFDMRSALTAFFVPFSTSIDVMTSMAHPLYSIGCGNNLILVFKKSGDDSEQLITRRVLVFHSVVSFLYGPAVDRMNPEDPDQKAVEWALLNKALREYDRLYHNSPSFLLEALEYFDFDAPAENHPLYIMCQKLIKDACSSQINGGIKRIIYSTILVDSKLVIAPKSSRVKPTDVLLTILVVSSLFSDEIPASSEWQQPSCDAYPERRASYESQHKNSIGQKDGEKRNGGDWNEPLQADTPYLTPHGTPGPVDHVTPPPLYTDLVGDGLDEPEPFSGPVRRVINILGGPAPVVSEGAAKSTPCESSGVSDAKFIEHLIFIQGKPHTLHCLELFKGIILVIVSEQPNKEFSISVTEMVNEMGVIFGGTTQKGQYTKMFDSLENTMKKITHLGRTEAQCRGSEQLRRQVMQVQRSWDGLKNSELKAYLEKLQEGQMDRNSTQSIRIDTQGRDLIVKLIKLFGGVYFAPRQAEYDSTVVREKLLRHCSEFSRDYAGFLVTIQYVDNLPKRGMDCTPGKYLKRKMWKMVERVQALLEQGYVVQCWKDSEFLYTYHAWVNIPYADIAGPLRYNQPKVHCDVFNIPGIIGTPFYSSMSHAPRRELRTKSSVTEGNDCFLYELYCIHEAAVPVVQAIKHSRMLVKTLWDTTQEAQIPFH